MQSINSEPVQRWIIPEVQTDFTGVQNVITTDLVSCIVNNWTDTEVQLYTKSKNAINIGEESDCTTFSYDSWFEVDCIAQVYHCETLLFWKCNFSEQSDKNFLSDCFDSYNLTGRQMRIFAMLNLSKEQDSNLLEDKNSLLSNIKRAKRIDAAFANYALYMIDKETEENDRRWYEISTHKEVLLEMCEEQFDLHNVLTYIHKSVIHMTIRPSDFVLLMASLNCFYERLDLCEEGMRILDTFLWFHKKVETLAKSTKNVELLDLCQEVRQKCEGTTQMKIDKSNSLF